jgi:hypothetical protein
MEIHVEGPSLERFSAEQSVKAWWEDCKTARRPNQSARKPYASRSQRPETDEESESELSFSLRDWDTWFGNSDESESDE